MLDVRGEPLLHGVDGGAVPVDDAEEVHVGGEGPAQACDEALVLAHLPDGASRAKSPSATFRSSSVAPSPRGGGIFAANSSIVAK